MHNRKVKLEIKSDKVREVLEKLNKNPESITISVDIEENKDTYKYLSTSDDIISWDFVDECECVKEECKRNSAAVKLEEDQSNVDNSEDIDNSNLIVVKDWNELSTYIEAAWRFGRKSPTVIWGTNFFYKTLYEEYNVVASSPLTLEHALLVMILQTYYRDMDIKDALEDTNDKLKNEWVKLKDHLSLASLSQALYEKK